MLRLPTEFKHLYPLIPEDSVCDAVEIAAIRAISTCFRTPSVASLDEDGIIHIYLVKDGNQDEISVNGLKPRVKRRLLDEIEIELMRRQAYFEAFDYKTIKGSVLTGQIERIKPDSTLVITMELTNQIIPVTLSAECPKNHQPLTERDRYQVGDVMEFFINSCLPVSNDRHAKVRIIASRVARELPSRMLAKLTGVSGIKCTKRYPGTDSYITSRHWIPNTAIVTVGNRLRERLHVKCLAAPQKKRG